MAFQTKISNFFSKPPLSSKNGTADTPVEKKQRTEPAPVCEVKSAEPAPVPEGQGPEGFGSEHEKNAEGPIAQTPTVHYVLCELPDVDSQPPFPLCIGPPTDYWDRNHVRLPCSPQRMVTDETGVERPHWNVVQAALQRDIKSFEDFKSAIFEYNPSARSKWSFPVLEKALSLFDGPAPFDFLIPSIARLALRLPELFPNGIPLLRHNVDASLTLSQGQISCLLANGFFCTFPSMGRTFCNDLPPLLPSINFSSLFNAPKRTDACVEKLKALFNYFHRVVSDPLMGSVTFHRRVLFDCDIPRWGELHGMRFTNWKISAEGTIESEETMVQMDFANKYIGGSVIGTGCVQEEIIFILSPECIAARVFVPCLTDKEGLTILGSEKYSRHTGYGDAFQYAGDYWDTTPRDHLRRRRREILALDAASFGRISPKLQFQSRMIDRELNKAYCGFRYRGSEPPTVTVHRTGVEHNEREKLSDEEMELSEEEPSGISTGNWGCGAFKGNLELKALIQLIAATAAGRNLSYFTFGDVALEQRMQRLYEKIRTKDVDVATVYSIVMSYEEAVIQRWKDKTNRVGLAEYCIQLFG